MNNACPSCRATYNITHRHVGRSTSCRQCGTPLVVEVTGLSLAEQPVQSQAYEAPVYGRPPQTPSLFRDFLVFRRMVMPLLIQILFWCSVVSFVILGFIWLIASLTARDGKLLYFTFGFLSCVFGPIFARLYCELLILPFRMNETLTEIKNEVKRSSRG